MQGCRPGTDGRGGAPASRREHGPGKYNVNLGAAFNESCVNKLYRQGVGHDEIVAALAPLIERYAKEHVIRCSIAMSLPARCRLSAYLV